ncbi:MAG: helix-hairpin-helix domain-containing protein [Sulfurimonas sp.]|nr:helix-hairpin-helix domain-containing protein [Sulfurimonas sp.]
MKLLTILFFSITLALATVDINNATAKDFTSLNGIGAKKAKAIVKYRSYVKCFKSINELTKVKGIGEAILSKNKNDLKLGKCKK